MLRLLHPWFNNAGKRVVKCPKIYIRDSGLFHALLSIKKFDNLSSHPKIGASWEGFAIENVCRNIGQKNQNLYFWSTHSGAEVDLFWQSGNKNFVIEFKYMDAPKLTKSMHSAINDLNLDYLWVIYPEKENYLFI